MIKIVLIILSLTSFLLGNPNWFYKIKASHNNEIIGYGANENLQIAKQSAINEIVKNISVQIESSTKVEKENINNSYSNNISSNFKIKTSATLNGVKFTKVEKYLDIWYVSASYDNSLIETKLKRLIDSDLKEEKQNKYLTNTPLFVNINKELNKKLNFKLIRKDNLWQIRKNDLFLPLTQKEFYKTFSNQNSKTISIVANKSTFISNDELKLNIKLNKKGYISILYSEFNGKVGILLANHFSNKSFSYPNEKTKDIFKIINPYKKSIKELYIAIYSKQPIDLSEFEIVNETLLDESTYNFNKLIDKLDRYDFSTNVIKIK